MSTTQKPDGDVRTADPAQDRTEEGLGAAGAQLSTQPVDSLSQLPAMGVLGWLRWMWRQLTSMRVALILLFLLSLAAIPGSLIPQRSDALKVAAFTKAHPDISPLYERLGMFHVYSSPWFSAIYILLFVSLSGCIIPRTWQFVGQLRARPPAAPRNLTRLPAYSTWRTDASPEQVAEAARTALRGRRFRTGVTGTSVAGEKGYLRETGNLIFHLALFGLLIGFALTSLEKAEGGKLIVEGDGFTNNLTQYDDFSGGTLYGAGDLKPFGFTLNNFDQQYSTSGPEKGTALKFQANISYWNGTEGKPVKGSVSVNHPLNIGGEKVYLISHGYAPVVTVRDGQGNVAYQGPVPFLPQDTNLTSTGVVKVPDAIGKNGKPDQLAFKGYFTPTGDTTKGPFSTFPELVSPMLWLNAYHGDLGLDSGFAQNVYQLDATHMKQYQLNTGTGVNGVVLKPGASFDLPDGNGSLTFDGVKTWASFSISHQSGNVLALVSGFCAIIGLMGSLFIQRRRIWVRADRAADGSTLVELGGLGRSESARIADELGDLAMQLQPDAPALPDAPGPPDTLAEPGDPGAPGAPDDPAAPADPAAPQDSEAPTHQTDDEGARA
ncbi:cytochrome c biogenesis protein [Streptomyces sp. DvalAA-14]|uniref:cytochrome c biogenesis protein ResB n=1 Tax=unclassified Streptomyces TaxID=2593676 RepID=UPI00081B1F3B|nr:MULTISPECIES: cytochrome c biogenesis protein ResB [unclassified Streptomyces]MYS20180.1 cytochrome c biogenesis protein ResB [Streptomyces sp. SID4948]SCD62679.1 cytochrome c biogenesis protein [Streptomyces sp. DvalAA-14]